MHDPFDALIAALRAAREAWRAGGEAVAGMDAAALVVVNERVGRARRLIDAILAHVAAEIARQSRVELGKDGLARTQGYRSPAVLVATATGISVGEAVRLTAVGESTAPRMLLSGEAAPARHPHVAAALAAGAIGVGAAGAIAARLDKLAGRVAANDLDEAERMLAEAAPRLSLDQLGGLLTRVEAHLDPDGLAPKEDDLRCARYARVHEDARTGAIVVDARLDPEGGAYVKTALEALVDASYRRRAASDSGTGPVAEDRRSRGQRGADALVDLARHLLGCDDAGFAHATTTVVVRIDLAHLQAGTGHGTIDGLAQPVSVGTVRRMAASGNVIPAVLGADSEILDWGRAKRLFTPAQRLALLERDGGCAFCGSPPHLTEAHHLRWWDRDHGATDLDNGVMLCVPCHHRVHDDGWEIEVRGSGTRATVWFVPPPWLDPDRTPRRGLDGRFGLAA